MKNEYRFAVGSPSGRRSTVWKFATWRSDIYIFSRMFGQHSKVSLHASGQCQWSKTSGWVTAEPGRRNAERHVVRWTLPEPSAGEAQWVFEVRIPESDLRYVDAPTETFRKVHWAPVPPADVATVLLCFLTPPSQGDPAIGAALPGHLLASFPLANGRWFVLVLTHKSTVRAELDDLRAAMVETTRQELPDFVPTVAHRACAFAQWGPNTRGLIELCLVG